MVVSTYGRGLWKIHTWGVILPFPGDRFCRGTGCNFRMLPDFETPKHSIDRTDKDVTIFLNGRINGIFLSGAEIKKLSVTTGTIFKRFIGKTKDFRELNIVESEQGVGFNELKGCLTVIENGEIIKGIILKENQMIGIISGKEEFNEVEDEVVKEGMAVSFSKRKFNEVENKLSSKSRGKQINIGSKKPYLFIKPSIPIMGTHVLGNDGLINLFAKGFRFKSKADNHVEIMIRFTGNAEKS